MWQLFRLINPYNFNRGQVILILRGCQSVFRIFGAGYDEYAVIKFFETVQYIYIRITCALACIKIFRVSFLSLRGFK